MCHSASSSEADCHETYGEYGRRQDFLQDLLRASNKDMTFSALHETADLMRHKIYPGKCRKASVVYAQEPTVPSQQD